jgi:hypothetical protein
MVNSVEEVEQAVTGMDSLKEIVAEQLAKDGTWIVKRVAAYQYCTCLKRGRYLIC